MNKPYDIEYLLEEVVTLPSLPSTVYHISQLTQDPSCPLGLVAKAISADPSLALKTLRLVNSAYYGLGQKVATIEHAVVLLGLKVINNLVITAAVFDTLKGSVGTLLKHSVACGVAMRVLAETCGKNLSMESGEEAFVYGLLHDVGKVVFEQFLPAENLLVEEMVRLRRVSWYQAEQEIIGLDHCIVGARIAEKWKLPDKLVCAIAGHHDLSKATEPKWKSLPAALAVADYVCTACAIPSHVSTVVSVSPEIWATTNLSSKDLPAFLNAFFDASGMVDELMRLAQKD